MGFTILHAPTFSIAQTVKADLTIEAEYGANVAKGSLYTAAHHQPSGPFMGRHLTGGTQPSPCNDIDIPKIKDGTILISHLDLDTIGGCLRAHTAESKYFPSDKPFYGGMFVEDCAGFWDLAETVDCFGPHAVLVGAEFAAELYAWWAWLKEHRPLPSRTEISDQTAFVFSAGDMLNTLLIGKESPMRKTLLKKGQEFKSAESALSQRSLIGHFTLPNGKVILLRRAGQFVNHLYRWDESGDTANAVVALNTGFSSCSLSLAFPDAESITAREVVQKVWTQCNATLKYREEQTANLRVVITVDGEEFASVAEGLKDAAAAHEWAEKVCGNPDVDPDSLEIKYLAGGHAGIGGGPRGIAMGESDLWDLMRATVLALQ